MDDCPAKRRKIEETEWVSASSTRNYIMNDGICDVYQLRKSEGREGRYSSPDGPIPQFFYQKGNEFEKSIISKIKASTSDFIQLDTTFENVRDEAQIKKTSDALRKGVKIIFHPAMEEPELQIFGIADFLVRSDSLHLISPHFSNTIPVSEQSSSKYVVVDIKFSTLPLRANGENVLSSGMYQAYKSQLWIYTKCLNYMNRQNVQQSFLMGRGYRFISRGVKYESYSPFDRLGIIDYRGIDNKIVEKTRGACEWIREVREKGYDWNLDAIPLPHVSLYPNMCNRYDYPWHGRKEQLATRINEITSLWRCGVSQREHAMDSGITQWTDMKCTPEALGFKEDSDTTRILSKILEVNRGDKLILPDKIDDNRFLWKRARSHEIYVDFETINDAFLDGSDYRGTHITMIGVLNREGVYKCFNVNRLDDESEERRIVKSFLDYISNINHRYSPFCFHWSQAEPLVLQSVISRVCPEETREILWFDLLKLFHDIPIVVKGALNFSLKSISKAMKNHGFIKSGWPENNDCKDGLSAMIMLAKLFNDGKPIDCVSISEIVEYNRMDCLVLKEIVDFLRKR